MNVASKIVLVACLAFLPVLAIDTAFAVAREEKLLRSDMERDLSFLASHLRRMAVVEWSRSGAEGVNAVVAASGRADQGVSIEWLSAPTRGRGIAEESDALVWLEPVVIDHSTVGAIQLTKSLAPMKAYLRRTVARLGVLSVVLVSGGLLVARVLSWRMIGQRLDRLVEFANETGAGRLGQVVTVGGCDEITRLGDSLGEMSKMLAVARRDADRLSDERLAMLGHLRHADRLVSLGRLAGGVAHELGTPLNVVMGHANRISEAAQASAASKESAAAIHRQVQKMATTIRDILGYARQAPGAEERVDLNHVVDTVSGLMSPLARRRGVQLDVEPTVTPAPVLGREIQLEQALSNLVSNAIDASPKNGRVVIGIRREARTPRSGGKPRPSIVLRVRDQGPGIPEADAARLFEPFFTTKAAGHGTGLGLWLAEGIVRDHGGSIEVGDGGSGGACFGMVLPECGVH